MLRLSYFMDLWVGAHAGNINAASEGSPQNELAAYPAPMDEGLATANSGRGSFPATLHISCPVPKFTSLSLAHRGR
jgi:hypothetical protein